MPFVHTCVVCADRGCACAPQIRDGSGGVDGDAAECAEPPSACAAGSFVYARLDAARQSLCFVVAVEGATASLMRLGEKGKDEAFAADVADLRVRAAPVATLVPCKDAMAKVAAVAAFICRI
jgi:hypothetical protein